MGATGDIANNPQIIRFVGQKEPGRGIASHQAREDRRIGRIAANETVRAELEHVGDNLKRAKSARQNSDALLAGKLYDDRGNLMSPSHAAKGGRRWRYYVSRALTNGRRSDAGSPARVPAAEIEKLVALDASIRRG
jgi:hypothetical protein